MSDIDYTSKLVSDPDCVKQHGILSQRWQYNFRLTKVSYIHAHLLNKPEENYIELITDGLECLLKSYGSGWVTSEPNYFIQYLYDILRAHFDILWHPTWYNSAILKVFPSSPTE